MMLKVMNWCKCFAGVKKVVINEPKCCVTTGNKRDSMLDGLQDYLCGKYDFRYNLLSETPEMREKGSSSASYLVVNQRILNTLCIDARNQGVNCWDKDVSRLLNSRKITDYHPFLSYMESLPRWDGTDRVTELAGRISCKQVWADGFHRWMLGLAAQWMGRAGECANSVVPLLVSREQGKRKSTFCKMLMPVPLLCYYIDKFSLTSAAACEQKLSLFGLVNLDEFDQYGEMKTAALKNLMQMSSLVFRKAHRSTFSTLPRMASFIGTSNHKDLLTDPTGSRRFLCVEVEGEGKIDCTPPDHEQLFAQLKAELAAGARYWFTADEERRIAASNREFYKQQPEEEVFYRCFRLPKGGEEFKLYSATSICTLLQKRFPTAMRGVYPNKFAKSLVAIGVERVHTTEGNMYRVVPLER